VVGALLVMMATVIIAVSAAHDVARGDMATATLHVVTVGLVLVFIAVGTEPRNRNRLLTVLIDVAATTFGRSPRTCERAAEKLPSLEGLR
jgi:hypothetical protein